MKNVLGVRSATISRLGAALILAGAAVGCSSEETTPAKVRGEGGRGGNSDAGADAAVDAPAETPVTPRKDSTPRKDASPTDLPVPPATAPAPMPWTVEDIGEVGVKGEGRYARDRFRLLGAGEDIGGKKDSFAFASYKVSGDFEAVAKVANVDYTHPLAKGGIMIRASNDPGAPNVFLAVTGGGSGMLQYRATAGGDTTVKDADKLNIKTDTWLKIVRAGASYKAYRSPDRAAGSWTLIDTAQVTLPADVLVGLAATSHDPANAGLHEFDAFRITNVAEPWFHEDIGLISGGAILDGKGALRLSVIGDAWSMTQEFGTYAYQMIEGDFVLTARAVSLDPSHDNARLGLLARNADNKTWSRSHSHAAVSITPATGGRFQLRTANGGMTMPGETKADLKAPVWLRLERKGNEFLGSSSTDGKTWAPMGAGMVAGEGIAKKITVGLVMTSGSAKAGGAGVFDNITLQAGAAPPPPPVDAGVPPPADAGAPDAAVDTLPAPDARVDTRADGRRG